MWDRVLELVIYFKFYENRSSGLGAVGSRKSPSPIDLAHGLCNCLYYRTVRDECKSNLRAWSLFAYFLMPLSLQELDCYLLDYNGYVVLSENHEEVQLLRGLTTIGLNTICR